MPQCRDAYSDACRKAILEKWPNADVGAIDSSLANHLGTNICAPGGTETIPPCPEENDSGGLTVTFGVLSGGGGTVVLPALTGEVRKYVGNSIHVGASSAMVTGNVDYVQHTNVIKVDSEGYALSPPSDRQDHFLLAVMIFVLGILILLRRT